MDAIAALDYLLPNAQYIGSLAANTEASFDAIIWTDGRPKPSWAEVEAGWAALLAAGLYYTDQSFSNFRWGMMDSAAYKRICKDSNAALAAVNLTPIHPRIEMLMLDDPRNIAIKQLWNRMVDSLPIGQKITPTEVGVLRGLAVATGVLGFYDFSESESDRGKIPV